MTNYAILKLMNRVENRAYHLTKKLAQAEAKILRCAQLPIIVRNRDYHSSNCRDLAGWRAFVNARFSEFRWARRLIGGRWERWWVDVVNSFIWHPVTEFSIPVIRLKPSPLCVGYPMREDWTAKDEPISRGPYR
jgi:hypothetical protein